MVPPHSRTQPTQDDLDRAAARLSKNMVVTTTCLVVLALVAARVIAASRTNNPSDAALLLGPGLSGAGGLVAILGAIKIFTRF
jgi:hypothetical protein